MGTLNQGYSYREQLGITAGQHSTLSYLIERYKHSDRATWKRRLARGEVLLDGVCARGDESLRAGQRLVWNRPPWQEAAVPRHYGVIYEDKALLAVTKPSGLPTLPAGGFLENTLLSVVRETYPEAKPLHRLGRGTSGLVLFARVPEAAQVLGKTWAKVKKTYRALSMGVAERDSYRITTPIGPVPHPRLGTVFAASSEGKPALSMAQVLERRTNSTVFEVDLLTGRPHQIRIHLAAIGHPLVGDPVYTLGAELLASPGLPGDAGYLLYAERLVLTHPVSGARLELHAPVPAGLEGQ